MRSGVRVVAAMEHDVFISHASEDKDLFVRDLAATLRAKGLAVWYDDFALRLGDSLSASIAKGLASSTFGVVVISPHFIAKRWPQRELAALIAREDTVDKVILPIWHGVTKQDLLTHLPLLADRLAANSSDGVEAVAKRILEVVGPERVAEGKYQEGQQRERDGDRDAAVSYYIEAVHIDQNHALALRRLAVLLSIGSNLHRAAIILGRVKYYSAGKGFGFIAAEDGQEYFVHVATLESQGLSLLNVGERVAFLIGEGRGKRQAAVSIRSIQ